MRKPIRTAASVACALVLGLAAIAAVVTLEQRADASRHAQVQVAALKNYLGQAMTASWNASADVGGNPTIARRMLSGGEQGFNQTVADLHREAPLPVLDRIAAPLRSEFAADEQIYRVGSTRGYGSWINWMEVPQNVNIGTLFHILGDADGQYAGRAAEARTLSTIGTVVAILLLLAAFLTAYLRAIRLAAINRQEAVTDTLTGLANRRALIDDLGAALVQAESGRPHTLALFDLDGFKQYNDTFGHAAGDVLLARLAHGLSEACAGRATAYRLGGDEFCVLAPAAGEGAQDRLLADATAALSGSAETWTIGSSAGVVALPDEARTVSEALALADVRMYSNKRGRSSPARQTADALLCLLDQRSPDLGSHIDNVADLAEATAQAMGLEDDSVREILWAAELHDVGKAAIPDAILEKPGPLDADEWTLMRRHTLLGERIMLAAPALAGAAKLVRSSHERVDGAGYPDGLRGEQIPLGARIIFVCDAFDAMTSQRAYNKPMDVPDALAELRRCAGTQFDPRVVETFASVVQSRAAASTLLAA